MGVKEVCLDIEDDEIGAAILPSISFKELVIEDEIDALRTSSGQKAPLVDRIRRIDGLPADTSPEEIWNNLFEGELYFDKPPATFTERKNG